MNLTNELYKNIIENFKLNKEDKTRLIDIIEVSTKNFEIKKKENKIGSFQDLIEEYLLDLQIRGYSPSTIKNKKYLLNKFNSKTNKDIKDLTTADIKAYILSRNNVKPVTLNNIIDTIKAFLSWAYIEEYTSVDLSQRIRKVKEPIRQTEEINQIDLEDIRNNCACTRDRAIIELALSSGVRASEMINIKITDINFEKNQIKVIGKGNKQRIVFFTDKTKYYILKYLEERTDNNNFLFVSTRKPFGQITRHGLYRVVNRIKNKCDIDKKVSPHSFRHCFATTMLNNGADITTIQKLLGHESINTTLKYAKISMDSVKFEYNKNVV